MGVTWVLVADSSRARIFSKNGRGPLKEEAGFIHPEGRLHEQELTSDLPGSASGHIGGERHGVGQRVPPKRHEAITFSKQVTNHLETARAQGQFHKLMVVAPPAFLGMLREQFSHALAHLVSQEINKNLVQLDADILMQHLPARI
ncbi:MAG: host attachment protein [Nitrospirae bacterium]|nr:host attachment protein [Nitrospirota bacterium]